MRLLENIDGKFKLTNDLVRDIPKYAILSHRWGLDTEEVTFRDLVEGTGEHKTGYQKIRFCSAQARRDGLRYFWVDTCCIDKSNNNELSTAINSMFRWYQNAARCYVYLDISASEYEKDGQPSELAWESAFRSSGWFTRGWTLQELLAPSSVEFFTMEGRRLGDKRSLEQQIHAITEIAVPALRGKALAQFDVDERFRWAETRQTTQEEDWAYCLLGIFGIFMPLIYGEGKAHAIRRLKREIAEAMNHNDAPSNQDPRSHAAKEIEKVKSFGSFEDWLATFSPAKDTAEGTPPVPTSSSLPRADNGPSHLATGTHPNDDQRHRKLSRNLRVRVTVKNLTRPSAPGSNSAVLPSVETMELNVTDFVYEWIQMLQNKGHKDVCGFRIRDRLFGPITPKAAPFPLHITTGPSSFNKKWLEINQDQTLDQFYDEAVRSHYGSLRPIRISRESGSLSVLDEYNRSSVQVSLNRTLRVPENGTVYGQPALFGPFPLLNVDLFQDKLPKHMAQRSGVIIPMFQREALSIGFEGLASNRHFAVKILAGGVSVVSGVVEGEERSRSEVQGSADERRQDYVVVPYQKRVDGFFVAAGVGIVRQFVAMPTLTGYTAEAQLKGKDEELAGIQLVIAPRFAGRGEFSRYNYRGVEPTYERLDSHQQRLSPKSLGCTAGQILFVSGRELSSTFQDVFCTGKDDALCTGSDFFVSDRLAIYQQLTRTGQQHSHNFPPFPHTDRDRPVILEELLIAAAVQDDSYCPGEPLTVEPVFRMSVTVLSRNTRDFLPAKGKFYTGPNPPYLGFARDGRYDGSPASKTWRVSPFLSLWHFYILVRADVQCASIVFFRGDQQLGNGTEDDLSADAALHTLVGDGDVVLFQAYSKTSNPYQTLGEYSAQKRAETASPWEMGLALGGQIYQDIAVDSEPEWWNWHRSRLVNIQILNSVSFQSFTGLEAPPPPFSFRQYLDAGLPFYHLVSQSPTVFLKGSTSLAKLKSVGDLDSDIGVLNEEAVLHGTVPVSCLVCEDNLADTILQPCNHAFCGTCVSRRMTFHGRVCCSACDALSNHQITFAGPMEVPVKAARAKLVEVENTKEADKSTRFVEAAEALTVERTARTISQLQGHLADRNECAAALETKGEQHGCRLEEPRGSYRTPLQLAAAEGRVDVVAFLVRVARERRQANADELAEEAALALELAAGAGHLPVVKLLRPTVPVNMLSSMGSMSPLEAAAENGHLDVVTYLLRNGHISRPPSKMGDPAPRSALHRAAAGGHAEIVKLLLTLGDFNPNLIAVDSKGGKRTTPAQEAAAGGHEKVLNILFCHGALIDEHNDDKYARNTTTMLLEAVKNVRVSTVRYLINAGVPTRGMSWDHRVTPLYVAVEKDNPQLVELLASRATGKDLQISAMKAARRNHTEILRFLCSFISVLPGNRQAENSNPYYSFLGYALLEAVRYGALETTRYLLESGADVHSRTDGETGSTALHLAAEASCGNSAATVRLLLKHGADIAARKTPRDNSPPPAGQRGPYPGPGETPLHVAVNKGIADVVNILLEAGSDICDTADDGRTCLHMVAGNRQSESRCAIARRLLDLGQDPNQKGANSRYHAFYTPLEVAISEGYVDLTQLLFSRGATLPSARLLTMAGYTHPKMVTLLLSYINFGDLDQEEVDFTAAVKSIVEFHFSFNLGGGKLSEEGRAEAETFLRAVLETCPSALDNDTIVDIMRRTAMHNNYAMLDRILGCIPAGSAREVAAGLSTWLGGKPRLANLARYLDRRYGEPTSPSKNSNPADIELPAWATCTVGPKGDYCVDEVDMTSNTLWADSTAISEKIDSNKESR